MVSMGDMAMRKSNPTPAKLPGPESSADSALTCSCHLDSRLNDMRLFSSLRRFGGRVVREWHPTPLDLLLCMIAFYLLAFRIWI